MAPKAKKRKATENGDGEGMKRMKAVRFDESDDDGGTADGEQGCNSLDILLPRVLSCPYSCLKF